MNFIHNDNICFVLYKTYTLWYYYLFENSWRRNMTPFEKQKELDVLEQMVYLHRFGFPVVSDPKELPITLEMMGIHPWRQARPGLSLAEYVKLPLTQKQVDELRFAPTPWVNVFHHPSGEIFTGFSSKGRPWSTIVVPLEDSEYGTLIPFTAEFKHGREQVIIVPVSGTPNAQERQQADGYESCAKRELLEESGIKLKAVYRLTGSDLAASGRQTDQGVHLFLGIADKPETWVPPNPDKTEYLRVCLMTADTFLQITEQNTDPNIGIELCSVAGVMLAMRRYQHLNGK